MNINTGKTPITTMTLLAILSLSLVVNLPGLAVTPMLSELSRIFPGTTETEKQLLTIIPNLVIIPFVLLSGKLSLSHHKIATIVTALSLFLAASIAYFFARSMAALILISCVLGAGAGLLIPFAAGLIADCFVGPQRMKIMGWKSGVSNISLVAATFVVGWLSKGNWHLPFIVYLLVIIPFVFSFWLKKIPQPDLENPQVPVDVKAATVAGSAARPNGKVVKGFYIGRISQIVGVYFFITFATLIISYYSPFLIQSEHLPDTLTGTVTSLFFLFVFLPGFLLSKIVKVVKGATFVMASCLILGGIVLFAFVPHPWSMCLGASITGLGYGISQPLIYDKASRSVVSDVKSTLALAIVLAANYVSIAVTPFIVDGVRAIFHTDSQAFPFYLSAALTVIYVVVTLLCRKSFIFAINKSYYNSKKMAPKPVAKPSVAASAAATAPDSAENS